MAESTVIENIETYLWDRWLIVRVICEDGTIGIGEGGVHGWQYPTEAMIKTIKPYLIGKDPSNIEHHYQYLYRNSHFMGSIINGALSAIDIALWDIKGRRLDVPIYDLMGGKTREKARCYIHVEGETLSELTSDSIKKTKEGFTAIRFTPYSSSFFRYDSLSEWIDDAENRVSAVREAVGNKIDLCIEIHRQMSPSESIMLGKRLEKFNLYFFEDPMLPDSPEIMKTIQERCSLPIATGERLTTIFEFQQLLNHKACSYVRPDLCLAGGLSGCKKIAAIAESNHIKVIPHNPLSPISTAACLQLDACILNFALQEYTPTEKLPPKSELLLKPLTLNKGYLEIPDGPGLGIELNTEALMKYPRVEKILDTPLRNDGSVADL